MKLYRMNYIVIPITIYLCNRVPRLNDFFLWERSINSSEAMYLLKLHNFIGFSHTEVESFFFLRPAWDIDVKSEIHFTGNETNKAWRRLENFRVNYKTFWTSRLVVSTFPHVGRLQFPSPSPNLVKEKVVRTLNNLQLKAKSTEETFSFEWEASSLIVTPM